MRKIFLTAFAACALVSCTDNQTEETTTTETMHVEDNGTMAGARTPAEGDVTYNGRTVQVYRGSTWEDADDDVTLDNGIIVRRDGTAVRDGDEYELEDGYVVDRDGNVWDRTGNAVGDAWDATKHGVKEAGKAVGNAAEKVGEKAKDIVD